MVFTLTSLKAEHPDFKLGSGVSTGELPVMHKRKNGTFGTHLRPPLSLPDGDELTALSSDPDKSKALSDGDVWRWASGFILAFASSTDFKGNGLTGVGWGQT